MCLVKEIAKFFKFIKLSTSDFFTSVLKSSGMIKFLYDLHIFLKVLGWRSIYAERMPLFLVMVNSQQTDSYASVSNFWIFLQMPPFWTYSIGPSHFYWGPFELLFCIQKCETVLLQNCCLVLFPLKRINLKEDLVKES